MRKTGKTKFFILNIIASGKGKHAVVGCHNSEDFIRRLKEYGVEATSEPMYPSKYFKHSSKEETIGFILNIK